jgi:hypothetical protein
MGILGRFYGRKDKEAMIANKKKSRIVSSTKNRFAKMTATRFPAPAPAVVPHKNDLAYQGLGEARQSYIDNKTGGMDQSTTTTTLTTAAISGNFNFPTDWKVVAVNSLTEANIREEVMQLLRSTSSGSCSVMVMANALGQSMSCKESHAKGAEEEEYNGRMTVISAAERKGRTAKVHSWVRRRQKDKEEMRRRYEWTETLDRLEKFPSSRDEKISSWEEAKTSLSRVLSFPSDESSPTEQHTAAEATEKDPIATKFSKKLETEFELISDRLTTTSTAGRNGYRTVASQANQLQRDIDADEDLNSLIHRVQKDLSFNATLRNQQDLYEKLRQSDAVRNLEERMKLKEANQRAASLMRPLTEEERAMVEEAIEGNGPNGEIMAQSGSDSVIRKSLRTLRPGAWLNDEVIHYFLVMLANRDEEMCKNDQQRKRSHFFKSFFITKLLNEGNVTCEGQYEYRNVKRWSKNVPGKDIFALDKIIFPVNMGDMHWTCVVAFMKEKRIQAYDSMGSSGRRYLDAIFRYINDEHIDKKKQPLPDKDQWVLVETARDTPQQRNGTSIFAGCNFQRKPLLSSILSCFGVFRFD